MAKTPKSEREAIAQDLAAKVMFASDKTCCICRNPRNNVQIHHIDEDPSNNDLNNLAVVCLNCHSEAHTNQAFARNTGPGLIAMYNESWRDIVKLRLLPPEQHPERLELASEAYFEASLICHNWKVFFTTLLFAFYSGRPPGPSDPHVTYDDVWDAMLAYWIPEFSPEAWKHFEPLFALAVQGVSTSFTRALTIFADAYPPDFKLLVVRGNRLLATRAATYPIAGSNLVDADKAAIAFDETFRGVIVPFREIAREAERRRKLLGATASRPPE